jgi:hypothetical protein
VALELEILARVAREERVPDEPQVLRGLDREIGVGSAVEQADRVAQAREPPSQEPPGALPVAALERDPCRQAVEHVTRDRYRARLARRRVLRLDECRLRHVGAVERDRGAREDHRERPARGLEVQALGERDPLAGGRERFA